MTGPSTLRRSLPPVAWLVGLYAFLPLAPQSMQALRGVLGNGGFRAALLAAGAAAAATFFAFLSRRVGWARPSAYWRTAPSFGLALWSVCALDQPQQAWHFPEYAILSVLIFRALPTQWPDRLRYGTALSLAVHAGVGDEILQHYLPNRYFDPFDIGLNALGALIGLVLLSCFAAPSPVRPSGGGLHERERA